MRDLTKVVVNKKASAAAIGGHPWIYGAEVVEIAGSYKNGDVVDVYNEKNRYLGSGFINDNSKILVRLLSSNANDRFDEAFFARRIAYSVDYRRRIFDKDDLRCCRLIFGDSDGLPGLIVDRFDKVLVVQVTSLGIELRLEMLIRSLLTVLRETGAVIEAVYLRCDVPVRTLEGLDLYKRFFVAEGLAAEYPCPVMINENGIRYAVDFINGQKTGFFLDQKKNRLAIRSISRGAVVLDCCTHTGSFALNAAHAGAREVVAVDASAVALETAEQNARLNDLDVDFIKADVFDYLARLRDSGTKRFDLIILDPPAFTKSSDSVRGAYRGYKQINTAAIRCLKFGSFLATCSCSHYMTNDLFRQMMSECAAECGVKLKQVYYDTQSPDHPVLWGVPETEYLKFYIFQIVQ